jgi:hypothetical protein
MMGEMLPSAEGLIIAMQKLTVYIARETESNPEKILSVIRGVVGPSRPLHAMSYLFFFKYMQTTTPPPIFIYKRGFATFHQKIVKHRRLPRMVRKCLRTTEIFLGHTLKDLIAFVKTYEDFDKGKV